MKFSDYISKFGFYESFNYFYKKNLRIDKETLYNIYLLDTKNNN